MDAYEDFERVTRKALGQASQRSATSSACDRAAGMQPAWVNRSGGPFDTRWLPPRVVVGSLPEPANALSRPA